MRLLLAFLIAALSLGVVMAGTVVMGRYGSNVFLVWLLVFAVFGWLEFTKVAAEWPARLVALAAFTFPCILLWFKSNEAPVGNALIRLQKFGIPFLLIGSGVFLLWFVLSSFRKKGFGWLSLAFVFGWAVVFLSSNLGGRDPMLEALMDWFGLSFSQAELYVFWIRKLIHFFFYGFAALVAFLATVPEKAVVSGIAFALIFAVFDEVRQGSFTGRTGSAVDILLDMAGAVIFVLVAKKVASASRRFPLQS